MENNVGKAETKEKTDLKSRGQRTEGLTPSGRGVTGAVVGIAMALGMLPWAARGQDALRMSLAGEEAAEARQQAASTVGYYNLQLGQSRWNLGAGAAMGYTDNINYAPSSEAKGDFVFRPQLNARMLLPVSEVNNLTFSLGAGYSVYALNSSYDRAFVAPGSELSFDLYSGDFWINFHDRFAIIDNDYQNPTVAGTGNYQLLENALGTAVTWDLNKIVLKLGCDYAISQSLGDKASAQVQGSQSELFSLNGSYALNRTTRLGLELSGSLYELRTSTTNAPFTEATQWSAGPFVEAQLTDYIRARVSAGYTVFDPQAAPGQSAASTDGVYAQVVLTHRLNQYVEYSLSGGRYINFSVYGGVMDAYYGNLAVDWKFIRKTKLRMAFNYAHGTQSFYQEETFDWLGPRLAVERQITEKLKLNLSYQIYWRTSDLANRDYTANVVGLNATYRF